MEWLIFTILAILSRAAYGVSTKVLSSDVKASPATQSVIFSLAATIIALISSPFLGGISFQNTGNVSIILAITILAMSFGNIVYYFGIKSLDSSTTQVTFSSILIWGTIFSVVFLGSKFSHLQFLGIGLLMFALLFVNSSGKKYHFGKGALFIVLSAGIFAVAQITSSILSKHITPATFLFSIYFGQTLIVGLLYIKQVISEIKLLIPKIHQVSIKALISSVTSTLFLTFSYFAFKFAPDSGVVVVLLTSQVIFAVILSIIFLKEKNYIKRKIIAGVLAVIAGFLIKG